MLVISIIYIYIYILYTLYSLIFRCWTPPFPWISQGLFFSLDETCHLFHQGETLPRNRREVCEVVGAWHSGVDCAGGGWWRSGGKLTPKSYGPWLFWMLWPWDETTPATKAKNVTWMRSASQIYLLRATSAFIELALLFCFVALLKGTETLEKIQRKIDHENCLFGI